MSPSINNQLIFVFLDSYPLTCHQHRNYLIDLSGNYKRTLCIARADAARVGWGAAGAGPGPGLGLQAGRRQGRGARLQGGEGGTCRDLTLIWPNFWNTTRVIIDRLTESRNPRARGFSCSAVTPSRWSRSVKLRNQFCHCSSRWYCSFSHYCERLIKFSDRFLTYINKWYNVLFLGRQFTVPLFISYQKSFQGICKENMAWSGLAGEQYLW